jgi:3-oxoacyl-[acyl-carrier-protein] synthase II
MIPHSSSEPRVAVVSYGVVSPLGIGKEATLEALRSGCDAVREVTAFDVSQTKCKTAAHVDPSFMVAESRVRRRLHPAAHMLTAAMAEAVAGMGDVQPELCVVGTTSGGMTFGENFYRAIRDQRKMAHLATAVANYTPQKPVLDALEAVGRAMPIHIIANACATGTNAIGHAFSLIRAGRCQSILCGGYDALSELVYVGFDSLQASTAEKIRPFDAHRTGLVLGEGAAVFALENWDAAEKRGANIVGEIIGYGVSTDTFNLTQPHPSGIGPKLAMQRALDSARITADQVDYINAHGTATHFNDATEGLAISELFDQVAVSSTKSMMGHSLGAAGAIEAAFSLLALEHGFLPPNINSQEPDPQNTFNLIANASRPAQVRRVLSNSFGFGGTNAAILLQRD